MKDSSEQLVCVVQQLQEAIQEQDKECSSKYGELSQLLSRLSATSTNIGPHKKIKLRIGEKKFVTTLATVTSEKETFFSAMFSSNFNTEPDEDGEFFIDRNPKYFALILDHLRGVDIGMTVADLSRSERDLFYQEVSFYCIRSLEVPAPRMKTIFVGFAEWEQNAALQSNHIQDALMEHAAASTFAGCRAATADEYTQQKIEGLPEINTSTRIVLFKGPNNTGNVSDKCLSGYALKGVGGNAKFDGTFTHLGLTNGKRSCVCVRDE